MKNRLLSVTLVLAAMVAAGPHAQQTRDRGAAPQGGSAGISGMVVTDAQTPQPVPRAVLTLTALEGGLRLTAFTNEAGQFSIPRLPAGRYNLAVTKPPFLRAAYGAKRTDGPGTPITLATGAQMTDVVLRMTPGAIITGRLTDENGEPAFGVPVRVMQMRMRLGERTFVPAAGAGSSMETTDDRGMYRFFGLPPGEYAVAASPRMPSGEIKAMTESEIRAVMQALDQAAQAAQNPALAGVTTPQPTPTPGAEPPDPDKVTVAYAPVYYPGTTFAPSLRTVTVGAGEERGGIDFALSLVRTTTVQGIIAVPQGIPPQSVQLVMTPTAGDTSMLVAGLQALGLQRATVAEDGTFTYTAVPPGQYTITARAVQQAGGAPSPGGRGAGGERVMAFTGRGAGGGDIETMVIGPGGPADPNATPYWAMADVAVDGTPIAGVALSLQPGMTVSGRVEFRSALTRAGGDFTRVRLNLVPVSTPGAVRINLGSPSVNIDPTGHFTIKGVTPGRYRLTGNAPVSPGSGPGAAWTLGSAIMKGQDVLDFPLDIGPNDDVTDAVVTFTDATQEVRGTLQDASGRPAPDYTIVVFPADQRYWLSPSRRIRSTRPGTDGGFSVTNLPPGDYRLAALIDVLPDDLNDPAFLEQLVGASYPFTLGVGEKKTQDLKIAGGL